MNGQKPVVRPLGVGRTGSVVGRRPANVSAEAAITRFLAFIRRIHPLKFARVRIQFPADPVLPVQAALADAEGIDLVQLRFGGVSTTGARSYVISAVGDPTALAAALGDTPEVVDHEVVARGSPDQVSGDGGIVYVRAEADPLELELHELFSQGCLVMTTPVDLYPDGGSVFRVLGELEDLRQAIESALVRAAFE